MAVFRVEKTQNYEYPQAKPDTPLPCTDSPHTENPYMDKPCPANPAQLNTNAVIPNAVNPYASNIHQSIPAQAPTFHSQNPTHEHGADAIGAIDIYRSIIHDNIGYSQLCQQHIHSVQEIDEIVEIMLETVCSKRPTIRVGREDIPTEIVRSHMLKVDDSHMEYVFECLEANTTAIYQYVRYRNNTGLGAECFSVV